MKGAQESCCVRLGEDFRQQVVGIRIAAALVVAKQYGDWYAEDGGHLFEPTACDTIGAAFVFLNLLEGYANLLGERRLRHSQADAVGSYTLAQADINGVFALWHSSTQLLCAVISSP
jgi:hypothetical protein